MVCKCSQGVYVFGIATTVQPRLSRPRLSRTSIIRTCLRPANILNFYPRFAKILFLVLGKSSDCAQFAL